MAYPRYTEIGIRMGPVVEMSNKTILKNHRHSYAINAKEAQLLFEPVKGLIIYAP